MDGLDGTCSSIFHLLGVVTNSLGEWLVNHSIVSRLWEDLDKKKNIKVVMGVCFFVCSRIKI